MRCPNCGHEWKLPGPQAGGRAKVRKGFASPEVQAKAQAAIRRKREAKKSNPAGQARAASARSLHGVVRQEDLE